jgi:mannose-6-phosphate isomerase-like protein (cupin superfamily)
MKILNNYLENWPLEIENAAKEKRILVIPPEQALKVLHGKNERTKISFFINHEKVHVGIITLNQGRYTDPEVHKGDEVLWALKGNVQVKIFDEDEDEESIFIEHIFVVRENQKLLIPEGCKHQYFNLSAGNSEILFAVAPEL